MCLEIPKFAFLGEKLFFTTVCSFVFFLSLKPSSSFFFQKKNK